MYMDLIHAEASKVYSANYCIHDPYITLTILNDQARKKVFVISSQFMHKLETTGYLGVQRWYWKVSNLNTTESVLVYLCYGSTRKICWNRI